MSNGNKKHYLIYQITNLLNGKIYIGKHITENIEDEYFGSGKYLKHAIQKYGLKNFEFKILIDLNNEEEMNLLEKCIVTEEFCDRKDTYNINVGGDGGWNYVNNIFTTEERRKITKDRWKSFLDDEKRLFSYKISVGMKNRINNMTKEEREEFRKYNSEKAKSIPNFINAFLGKHHTEETKRKIGEKLSIANKGKNNPNYGKHWYYNPETNEQNTFKEGEQPKGWIRGIPKEKCQRMSKNLPHGLTKGKIQIYNKDKDIMKYIFPNEEIPEGFIKGGRPLSESGKEKLRNFYKYKLIETSKTKINELRPLYSFYKENGWDKFKSEFNYKYSRANFLQSCKKYLEEYDNSQQGKKISTDLKKCK